MLTCELISERSKVFILESNDFLQGGRDEDASNIFYMNVFETNGVYRKSKFKLERKED